jgi:hypothetical protein
VHSNRITADPNEIDLRPTTATGISNLGKGYPLQRKEHAMPDYEKYDEHRLVDSYAKSQFAYTGAPEGGRPTFVYVLWWYFWCLRPKFTMN